MAIILGVLGAGVVLLVLVDGFQTMVLPRRVAWRYRPARLYYRFTWRVWRALFRLWPAGKRRHTFLSIYGPLSLLGLFFSWVLGLILGFAFLHQSLGPQYISAPDNDPKNFWTYLYLSGGTFFTVGYGDIFPLPGLGRVLAVVEAGLGFGFLAVIIGYLPVLYQAFSKREVSISLLDARAGSPPSAGQLLLRLARARNLKGGVDTVLAEWERWSAEVLESHLSFPVLTYYRSQHDNQSWLAALTTVLDSCAVLLALADARCTYQAQLTFAMARHTLVDLSLVFGRPPLTPEPDRLPPERLLRLRELLRQHGVELREGPAADAKLVELRGAYEPFANGLAQFLLFTLPDVVPEKTVVDNWQTSAWMRRVPGIGRLPATEVRDEHFD
jgi:hypothetical protein